MSSQSLASFTSQLPPVIQIVGYKNSGKTTLIASLLRLWAEQGTRVAVIKHDAHAFQMDHPGTDTFTHTEAGAAAVAITSPSRTAVIREQTAALGELVNELAAHDQPGYDLILVEGFKRESYPKIAIVADLDGMTLLDELVELKWIYTRIESTGIDALSKEKLERFNLEEIPVIPSGKDGIMKLFIALNAYIASSQSK